MERTSRREFRERFRIDGAEASTRAGGRAASTCLLVERRRVSQSLCPERERAARLAEGCQLRRQRQLTTRRHRRSSSLMHFQIPISARSLSLSLDLEFRAVLETRDVIFSGFATIQYRNGEAAYLPTLLNCFGSKVYARFLSTRNRLFEKTSLLRREIL